MVQKAPTSSLHLPCIPDLSPTPRKLSAPTMSAPPSPLPTLNTLFTYHVCPGPSPSVALIVALVLLHTLAYGEKYAELWPTSLAAQLCQLMSAEGSKENVQR